MVIVEALGVVGNSSEENDEEDKMKMIEIFFKLPRHKIE